ncbi:ligase-associated DNA damage response endonuclease PdeM [Mangrovicoccus algicola]|uniref:Ligase-associated DNA damage response endonuclease PdeM n=1 Tax=Mangrovicoccus algicola TaxID=2771008 RepID=A0A8J7CIT9_9RHOB|nr:ligase-associated DNA damage response endonuclease PdeM [Mangrovicoccus algicola]MBE3640005.1 ligase-associated DNA damage response endonuclease PdeM [Mangrovicoccus algicola]
MDSYDFDLAGIRLRARPSGALHWPGGGLLCVSDLHLGKAGRIARRGGTMLPPYETLDTLHRLAAEIAATGPGTIVALGDSFDDLTAAGELEPEALALLLSLSAGRRWIWIAGNHDAGPVDLPGSHLAELHEGPLVFRHIAEPAAAPGEISGHYHPAARIGGRRRPCFAIDATRAILPAFGTYTGGLDCDDPALAGLMAPQARAVLTGHRALPVPLHGRPQPRRRIRSLP